MAEPLTPDLLLDWLARKTAEYEEEIRAHKWRLHYLSAEIVLLKRLLEETGH
ncbi:unnamed protein product [marine sediment metagenome]|uniref:Uncharacterized protein n=1 Tax=marine sediment metagenome TaxID=412755 RepID=X1F876_9ZZZZ